MGVGNHDPDFRAIWISERTCLTPADNRRSSRESVHRITMGVKICVAGYTVADKRSGYVSPYVSPFLPKLLSL